MRRIGMPVPLVCVISAFVAYATVGCGGSERNASMRVGAFDSRAVAVAYGRSDAFKSHIAGRMAEYENARAMREENRMRELEAEFLKEQEVLHKQGFSTWTVDNILEQIGDRIPEIAKQADVDAIVNRWDVVYQRPEVEFIDVTDLLVDLFAPDEETRNIIGELVKQDPIPLEELEEQ